MEYLLCVYTLSHTLFVQILQLSRSYVYVHIARQQKRAFKMGNWPMNSPLALKVLKCKLPALFSTGDKAPQQTLQGPLSADIRKPTVCWKCMKDMVVLLQAHGPFSVERLYSFYYMPKGFALNQLCGILDEASVLQQFREEMNHKGATYSGQVCFTQEGSCHSQRSLRNMGGGESFSVWGILGVRK